MGEVYSMTHDLMTLTRMTPEGLPEIVPTQRLGLGLGLGLGPESH